MSLVQTLPGVTWRGRIGQPELYKELLKSGVWCYPSTWKEENCISSYLAQACGAWPVVFPMGALGQSVVFGWKVDDAHFVEAVCEAAQTQAGRQTMMEWTRRNTSWDDCAAYWERLFIGRLA